MRLHLGNGDVYLKDHLNVDANPLVLSADHPEQADEQAVTFENYYNKTRPHVYISDITADIMDLPFPDGSASHCVLIHVLEHIQKYNVEKVLSEIHRVLEPNGELYIAVPDTRKMAQLLASAITVEEEALAIRYLYGTQKNKYSHHYTGYTEVSLMETLQANKFWYFEEKENFNSYPSIHMTAKKVDRIMTI